QDHGKGLLVGQHILRKLGTEARQSLVDGGEAFLRRLLERGAGAHESGVVALHNTCLLRAETKRVAPLIERGYAGVERRIEVERVVMAGEQRGHVPLFFLCIIRLGFGSATKKTA